MIKKITCIQFAVWTYDILFLMNLNYNCWSINFKQYIFTLTFNYAVIEVLTNHTWYILVVQHVLHIFNPLGFYYLSFLAPLHNYIEVKHLKLPELVSIAGAFSSHKKENRSKNEMDCFGWITSYEWWYCMLCKYLSV